jgi:hypothetical protein
MAQMTVIKTFTGRLFDYTSFSPDDFDIVDIASALSKECRFAGHCHEFYSVAQHSFEMSSMVHPDFSMEALLHDASEAYLKDIPSPLKRMLPDYQELERRIDSVIRIKFNLPPIMSPEIKKADADILKIEMRSLYPERFHLGHLEHKPDIKCMSPTEAKSAFLMRYKLLCNKNDCRDTFQSRSARNNSF